MTGMARPIEDLCDAWDARGVGMSAWPTGDGAIELAGLDRSSRAEAGSGMAAARDLCALADAHGARIALVVLAGNDVLVGLYAALGFRIVAACPGTGDASMSREPAHAGPVVPVAEAQGEAASSRAIAARA